MEDGGRCEGGGHSGKGGSEGTGFSLDATATAAAWAVAAAVPSLSLRELDLLKVLLNSAFMVAGKLSGTNGWTDAFTRL